MQNSKSQSSWKILHKMSQPELERESDGLSEKVTPGAITLEPFNATRVFIHLTLLFGRLTESSAKQLTFTCILGLFVHIWNFHALLPAISLVSWSITVLDIAYTKFSILFPKPMVTFQFLPYQSPQKQFLLETVTHKYFVMQEKNKPHGILVQDQAPVT